MKNSFKVSSLKQFLDLGEIDQAQEVQRKQYNMGLTIGSDEERTIVANVTTIDIDHEGDCVMGKNMDLSVFMKNPAIMWSHQYNQPPIGKCLEMSVTDTGIAMKMEIAKTGMAEECWQLLKGKFLRGCSIGFIPTKAIYKGTEEFKSYIKDNALKISDKCERIITNAILLENSLCSLGCNPSALVVAVSSKSIHLSEKTLKELELDKAVIAETKETPVIPIEPLTPEEVKEVTQVVDNKEVKKQCPYCDDPECDGTCEDTEGCDECPNEDCAGYALYLASKKPKAVVEPKSESIVEPIVEPKVEAPKSYIKVIRNGGFDIKTEIEKEKSKLAGKIV